MKKLHLTILAAFGLCLSSHANDLVWTPTTAVWDISSLNWSNTVDTLSTNFATGDNVLFNDTGIAQAIVKLSGSLSAGAVVVDAAANYTVSTNSLATDRIGSLTSLTKRGAGKLTIETDNIFSGPTSIEGGQLQIGNGAAKGALGGGPITNLTGLVINRTGTLNLSNYLTGAGGFTNRLGATVNVTGANTMSGPILIQVGLLSLSNAPAQGSSTNIILDASPTATANSRLGLTGGINLPAEATLSLLGTVGGATPSRDTVQTVVAADPTTNSVNGPILIGSGNGLIQLNGVSVGTGLLKITGNVSNHPDNATPFSGTFYLRGAGNGILTGTVNLPEASFAHTDAGTFTVASTGHSWSGTLVAVGRLRLGIDNALPNNVPFSMGQTTGTNAILDLNGFNQQLPGVTSVHVANANLPIIANSSTASDSILTISAPAGNYGGFIQDSIYGGTRKVGLTIISGAQVLTTNCTYSGPTTILGGGLALKDFGSISNTTSIDITGPAALDVSLRTDGTLWLGAAQTLKGNGTFKVVGKLASAGTIQLKLNKTGGTLSNDQLLMQGVGEIGYGGSLVLALSGDSLASGDSFKLFDATTYGGTFGTITPTTPGSGLTWDLSTLATDGTIRVAGGISTNPPSLTSALVGDGSQLQLSWPLENLGWVLQTQTNANGVGLDTNWFPVSGSALTNGVYQDIDRTQGGVYFRLFRP